MRTKLLKFVSIGLLLISHCAFSDGIDKTFTTSLKHTTWGDLFNQLFNKTGFNKSYALVIGVNEFSSFENLNTANDAIRIKDYLLNEARFDYVRLITNDQVNLNKIRSIMVDDIPNKLRSNDRFLFYWSGHGTTETIKGKKYGYLPVSNSLNKKYSSMLSMSDLSKWDGRLRAKQTFYLLDACFSGLAGYQVKSNLLKEQTIEQIARPSRQILTAGLDDEKTIVINQLGGSVFTTAVLDGLRGAADTEAGPFKRDGIVSARELELYVKKRVSQERINYSWKKPITPLLTRLSHEEGDFFFFSGAGEPETPIIVKSSKIRTKSAINYNRSSIVPISRKSNAYLLSMKQYQYRAGASDTLKISVWVNSNQNYKRNKKDLQPISVTKVTIDSDGSFMFPYTGRIKAKDRTTDQIRELIEIRLSKFYIHPTVLVEIVAYKSQQVNINGNVRNPGILAINNVPLTVRSAISKSGGLSSRAGNYALLVHHKQKISINLDRMFRKGVNDQNYILRGGDSLFITDTN